MTMQNPSFRLSFGLVLLTGLVAVSCGGARSEQSAAGVCPQNQPDCFGGEDGPTGSGGLDSWSVADSTGSEDGGTSPGEGSADDPGTDPSDGASDDPADIPGQGTGGVPGEEGCGVAFARCLEEGGDWFACAPLHEDCGTGGGTGSDGQRCCDELDAACDDSVSVSSATCDELAEICESEDCATLVEICPADQVPLSEPCAFAYRACYPGLSVNNCVRIPYDACVLLVGDAEFCAQRDAACETRIQHCHDLLGPGSGLFLYCAENGEYFAPCWESLGCDAQAPTCSPAAVQACVNPLQGTCGL